MRMPFQIDLIGKVVLITGVSSGIGLGTAHEFARAGACVAGCARKPESDDSVSAFLQAVEGEGCKALYVQADVTQEEELEKLVQEVIATFGRLDIVVSNAGMNVFEGAAECSESRWAYNLDLNLASHWRLARIAKPYLEQSGNGVILLMTSNHAFCSIPGCFPYNVTKTAITGLVRSLTIEWGLWANLKFLPHTATSWLPALAFILSALAPCLLGSRISSNPLTVELLLS